MKNKFTPLEFDEVISVDNACRILLYHPTFKVSELVKAAIELFKTKDNITSQNWTEEKAKWISEGVNAEVLKYGANNWQKGKVRLTIEFCPDEPEVEETLPSNPKVISKLESPLDDLRRMMKDNG